MAALKAGEFQGRHPCRGRGPAPDRPRHRSLYRARTAERPPVERPMAARPAGQLLLALPQAADRHGRRWLVARPGRWARSAVAACAQPDVFRGAAALPARQARLCAPPQRFRRDAAFRGFPVVGRCRIALGDAGDARADRHQHGDQRHSLIGAPTSAGSSRATTLRASFIRAGSSSRPSRRCSARTAATSMHLPWGWTKGERGFPETAQWNPRSCGPEGRARRADLPAISGTALSPASLSLHRRPRMCSTGMPIIRSMWFHHDEPEAVRRGDQYLFDRTSSSRRWSKRGPRSGAFIFPRGAGSISGLARPSRAAAKSTARSIWRRRRFTRRRGGAFRPRQAAYGREERRADHAPDPSRRRRRRGPLRGRRRQLRLPARRLQPVRLPLVGWTRTLRVQQSHGPTAPRTFAVRVAGNEKTMQLTPCGRATLRV